MDKLLIIFGVIIGIIALVISYYLIMAVIFFLGAT